MENIKELIKGLDVKELHEIKKIVQSFLDICDMFFFRV
jgi:hypothetical protein